MTTIYTPKDVYTFAENGNVDELIIALNQGDNSTNWYRDGFGWTALHEAARNNHMNIVEILLDRGIDINSKICNGNTALHIAANSCNMNIVEILLDRGIDINSKDNDGNTALHWAARWGYTNIVEILLNRGIDIDDDINKYAPDENENENEDEDGNIIEYTDCRPMIFAEVEHRRKRPLFDSFINHHIEYQPYINSIYTLCYPTGNIQVAKPPVGWIRAEAIRDKYYLDEIFFYLHMHIANCYTNNQPDAVITTSSSLNSMNHAASNSDKTSTLMIILTDRLRMYLKPNQELGVEVPYVQKENSN